MNASHHGHSEHTPTKAYLIEERLVGAANYTVYANSKEEAEQAVRDGKVDMDDTKIQHTGSFKTRRAKAQDR